MECPACAGAIRPGARFCPGCGAELQVPCPHCGSPALGSARFCEACGNTLTGGVPAAAGGESTSAAAGRGERRCDSDSPEALPTAFAGGRYQIRRFLGEGGRKRVYAAYDTALRREVALATVKTEGLDDAGLVRVRREAQSMALLGDHPHIVTVYDIGEDAGRPFIVSQFMSGGSIEDLLARAEDHRLAVADALRLGGEIAAALEHAHGRGVIHRDLKPANVWLTEDGSARLGDFGLAVAADHSRITSEGMMVGTVAYMAPEQAMGGEVGTPADLYSLGALLYELLTGRPPFVGGDAVSVISQHLNTQPMAPWWHNPAVPRPLGTLVLELLAKNAEERPPGAAAVRRRLAEIASNPAEPTLEMSAVALLPAAQRLARIGRRGRFVGRGEELGILKTAIESTLDGRGGLVLVSGEPGVGKSRLVEEAGVYARLRGAQVLAGRCYETETVLLLQPFAEAIRSYVVREPPGDLLKELGEGASDVASLVSEVRQRLPDLPPSRQSEDAESRFHLFESVSNFLVNAAAVHPIVLVFDELHWADAPSLRLLCHLSRRLAESRLLVLGTYREAEVTRGHPLTEALGELRRTRGFEPLALGGLSPAEVRELLEAIAERRLDESETGLAEVMWRETEGNPFFLEEVVRHLLETGGAQWEAGKWTIDPASLDSLKVPEGIRDVVSRRFSSLTAGSREVLARASVLGREFDVTILGRMGDLDDDTLLEAVEEAVDARLIVEVTGTRGQAAYAFAQPVVRQTLYEELSVPRRQRLHRSAADAIEALHAANLTPHLAALAQHCRRAGPAEVSRAIEYGVAAGEAAEASFLYEDAARHWADTLELLDVAGEAEARAGLSARLGELYFTTGLNPAGSVDCLERALRIYETLGEERHVAETHTRLGRNLATFPATLDIPRALDHYRAAGAILTRGPARSALGYVVFGLAATALWGMQIEVGLAQVEQALEIADRRGNDGLGRNAIALRGHHVVASGRLDDGFRGLETAWQAADRTEHLMPAFSATWIAAAMSLDLKDPRTAMTWCQRELDTARVARAQNPRQTLQAELARAHALAGNLAQARRAADESALAKYTAPMLAFFAGDFDEAAELWADQQEDDHRRGNRLYEWAAGYWLGVLHRFAGDPASSTRCLEEALRIATEGRSVVHEMAAQAELALTLVDAGSVEEAEQHLARIGEILAGGEDWRGLGGRTHLASAAALVAGGRLQAAETAFGDATAIFHRLHLAWDEAEAFHRWGRARLEADDRAGAQEKLSQALEIYQRISAGSRWIEPVVADKLAAQGIGGALVTASIDLVAAAVSLERPDLSVHASPEGTVTILFSDIEGSTAANQRLGDRRWLDVLRAHNRIIRREVAAHRGFEVKSQGDGFMVAFGSARRAVLCAVGIQRALSEHSQAHPDEGVRVRIGLHTGEVMKEAEDFFGTNVALAARIASAACGSEILVSGLLKDLLESAGDVEFGAPRELDLKGLPGPRRVHEIVWQPVVRAAARDEEQT
jgi:eukaryotic-like serine/threonine-protein kinase